MANIFLIFFCCENNANLTAGIAPIRVPAPTERPTGIRTYPNWRWVQTN